MGASARLGFALREDLSMQVRYSLYRQEVVIGDALRNCNNVGPTAANGFMPFNPTNPAVTPNCYSDGEASIPVKLELLGGPVLTSAVGYTLAYNTLDNNRDPTNGLLVEFKQDAAGLGGDVRYLRSTIDARMYYPVFADVVGVLRGQAGNITGLGGSYANGASVRMLDHFQMGPNLVRGFAPLGLGPRDINSPTQDALGGTMYWGASAELQTPFWFLPKEVGLKGAVYADVGSVWDYKGPQGFFAATGETLTPAQNNMIVRSSVGAALIWQSPFGPLRFDYAVPLSKGPNDRTQVFRFGGGTSF
jgi:outer membrane protein insertion porin family